MPLYKKSGVGNWSNAASWSSVSAAGVDNSGPPTASTDVILEALSGDLTIDSSAAVCRSLNCTSGTGDFAGTLTHGAFTCTVGDGTAGAGNVALKFSAGMTLTISASPNLSYFIFASTSATQQTVTTAGKQPGSVEFNGAGGSWILSDDLTLSDTNSSNLAFTKGTWNTNGKTVTCGNFGSQNSNTRTLTLGASAINVTQANNSSAMNFITATNLTMTANTAIITISGNASAFRSDTLNWNGTSIVITGTHSSTMNLNTNGCTLANLTITGTTQKIDSFTFSGNITITGTFTITGNTAVNRVKLGSSVAGTQRTITAGAVVTAYVDWQDITGAGAADWNLTHQAVDSSGDCGGNSGITFTTSATQTSSGTASFSWSTAAIWTSRVPLPQDDYVVNNSFVAGRTITVDMPRMGRSGNFSGCSGGVALNFSVSTEVFGSLTLATVTTNMTVSVTGNALSFSARSAVTITSAGNVLPRLFLGEVSTFSVTLQDAMTLMTGGLITLTAGTLAANGFSVTAAGLDTANSSITRVVNLGSSTWTMNGTGNVWRLRGTNISVTASTSTIAITDTSATEKDFTGASLTYNNLTFSGGTGICWIGGSNTFNALTFGAAGATNPYRCDLSTTQTFSTLTINGDSTHTINFDTYTGAGTLTISRASGFQYSKYATLTRCVATGGAVFIAKRSTLGTGTTGWVSAATIVGAGGNTSATGTWDTGTVPTAVTYAYIDSDSGAATIDAAFACRSLDCTGYTNTLTHNAFTVSIGDATVGASNAALTLASGMTLTNASGNGSKFSFVSTNATQQTVTTAGKLVGTFDFNGVGGSWIASDNWSCSDVNTSRLALTKGTLNTNDKTIAMGSFDSANGNTRTLTMGASAFNLNAANNILAWGIISSNMTITANTAIITLGGNNSSFGLGASQNLNGASFVMTGIPGNATIIDGNSATIQNLTITGTATKTGVYYFVSNITITSTFAVAGNSATNRPLIASTVIGTPRTITAAVVSCSNVDFADITGAGAGNWDLSAISGGAGDALGNSGITFTPSAQQFWKTATPGVILWSTVGNWFLATNGGGGAGRVPLPQDDARFDANSIGASGINIRYDMPRSGKNINFTGVTNSPVFGAAGSITTQVFGSLTLGSGMTTGVVSGFDMCARGSISITSAGVTWNQAISILSGTAATVLTLGDALSSTSGIRIDMGTFTTADFSVTAASINLGNNAGVARTVNLGNSTVTITTAGNVWSTTSNVTINAGTSTIVFSDTSSSQKTFMGSGYTYNNLTCAGGTGTISITGSNTFKDLALNAAGATNPYRFTSSTTTTVQSLSSNADATHVTSLDTVSGSGTFTLVDSSGTNAIDYCTINRSTVQGGAGWYAGANSTNGGSNSGWFFRSPTTFYGGKIKRGCAL